MPRISATTLKPKLELLHYPDPRLQLVCTPVSQINPINWDLINLIDQMWVTLNYYGGFGLAAPQLGSPSRVIICNVPGYETIEMVDPVIVRKWGGMFLSREGCLSYPGKPVRVMRHKRIRISGYDRWGHKITVGGKGQQAACIQHEINHLDGINIADFA